MSGENEETPMARKKELIEALRQAILEGDEDAALSAAGSWVAAGFEPVTLLDEGGTATIREVGELFSRFEIYLPELILAGDALKAASEVLTAEMRRRGTALQSHGKIVIGTVEGDVHDIGKNLVASLLVANGFEVVDLGVDVPAREIVAKAQAEKADIIALSALMTTSSFYQQQVIQLLAEVGRRDDFFVIVGGGPVTGEWAEEIGADGYGRMASDAVPLCLQLLAFGERQHESKTLRVG